QISGAVTTSGTQTYTDAVELTGNATLNGTDIALNGAVSGAFDLTINGSGVTTLDGGVDIANLTTDAVGSTSLSGTIQTSGTQTYDDAVLLLGDTVLIGSGLSTNGVAGAGNDLTLTISGVAMIDGSFTNIADLTSNGAGTTELSGSVTTTGFQLYSNNAVLTDATALTGTDVSFDGTLSGDEDLTVDVSGVAS